MTNNGFHHFIYKEYPVVYLHVYICTVYINLLNSFPNFPWLNYTRTQVQKNLNSKIVIKGMLPIGYLQDFPAYLPVQSSGSFITKVPRSIYSGTSSSFDLATLVDQL
jgi:hypothetical protein